MVQGSARGQIGVEFRQEFNGHGPRHVTRVRHVSSRVDTCPLITLIPDELQGSVRGQIGVKFRQEFNGHGPRHLTCVFQVSTRVCY